MPACCRMNSMHMREGDPSPPDAKVSAPGRALAAATRSRSDPMPCDACATSTDSLCATAAIGARSRRGSYGTLDTAGAITRGKSGVKRSVWPSGAALTTWLIPLAPPAPSRTSTTTGVPHDSVIFCEAILASRSGGVLAGKGTMNRTVWAGYAPCAYAAGGRIAATRANAQARATEFISAGADAMILLLHRNNTSRKLLGWGDMR